MTTAAADRYTFRDGDERETGRIMLARLLVRQAELLKHEVDPQVASDASRPLPDERSVSQLICSSARLRRRYRADGRGVPSSSNPCRGHPERRRLARAAADRRRGRAAELTVSG